VIAAVPATIAQGVPLAAGKLGLAGAVDRDAASPPPEMKVRRRGRAAAAEVVCHGDTMTRAYLESPALEASRQLSFIHALDDSRGDRRPGTVGLEMPAGRASASP